MARYVIVLLLLFSGTHCTTAHKLRNNSLKIPDGLRGDFTDDYGIHYTINDSVWTQHPGIRYHIIAMGKNGSYLITRNDTANTSNPGLFTRIDIMNFTGMEPYTWGFCLTVYDARTLKEAAAATPADRLQPKNGCGGYPFSRMKKTLR